MSLSPFTWKITKDGSATLFDERAGESYKSAHAAETESHKIFLEPGILSHPAWKNEKEFRVLELGFGIGTNFRAVQTLKMPNKTIFFTSVERDLSGAIFYASERTSNELELLLKHRTYLTEGFSAQIVEGEFFSILKTFPSESFHSIFFDPFSPKANPESWCEEIFQECSRVLRADGRLLTYSVSRKAKDNLQAAGFKWQKHNLPEILNKRSALIALKRGEE